MNSTIVFLLISVFLFSPSYSLEADENHPPPPPSSSYWFNNSYLKALLTYLFPPTLDFRGSKNEEESRVSGGEKAKEAVVKTLDKGMATLDKSARAAANLAKDAFSPNQPQEL